MACEQVEELVDEAQQAGLALDAYTCSALVQGRLGAADYKGAWQALADMRAAGVCPTKVLLQPRVLGAVASWPMCQYVLT